MLKFPLIVAYNMEDKKIGCPLVQAILGSSIPPFEIGMYFETQNWELNPSNCKLYSLHSQEVFDLMIEITKEEGKSIIHK